MKAVNTEADPEKDFVLCSELTAARLQAGLTAVN